MEERGTPASATPLEFPFTPLDTPIETESRWGEDEDADAEVEEAARERAAFSEASYVPRIHFFVPFGVDAFVLCQSLQEEQVLHDLGSHMGMSGPLVLWNLWTGLQADFLVRSQEMVERLSGAMEVGGNESEAATGASGSRGSRRGGASSHRRSVRGRGTGRVAEAGHTFSEVSRVLSVVTREGIEGEIAIPSRFVSITLPEAEVPRAWAENVYRLLLDCFTVIRQGAMGVSPEVLPRGATAAAQRGGARQRSSSGGPTGREGGREESSSRGGGRGEATSRGRGVWTVKGSALAFLNVLRSLSSKAPVNPFKKIGIAKTLSEKLGISNNAAKSLTEGRVLNIPRLLNQLKARITIPRDPYPSVLLPQDYEDWLIQDVETRIGWNEE
ncbi:hypothetical protein RHSIM_RhsimUnG0042400 [Rhododendron simsii]|uniref:Uncharacterized protein n=1 Tax=Rhododendron simsii TaxID=118357 RepID=A0A834L4Z1_RHOSS|nr:hypothetical protein RHSIM_RhsimUnG0042400 [Rhododendron simsii]